MFLRRFIIPFLSLFLLSTSSTLFASSKYYLGMLGGMSFASSGGYLSLYELGSCGVFDDSVFQPAISDLSEVYYGAYEMDFAYGHSAGVNLGYRDSERGIITELEYTRREQAKSVANFIPHSISGPQNYLKYFVNSLFFNSGYVFRQSSTDALVHPFFGLGVGMINYSAMGEYRIGLHTDKAALNANSVTRGDFAFESRVHPALNAKFGLVFSISDFIGVAVNYRGTFDLGFNKEMRKKDFVSSTSGKNFFWSDGIDSGSAEAKFEDNNLLIEGSGYIDHSLEMILRFAIGGGH